ncbi:MAG: hypothetical protein KAR21_19330 [Spirochaetales bacterium]|nr:hypothetical protein [Spirochaetales bacterium]
MKDISEYSADTSIFELSAHLYERIINRKINTFSELREYTSGIPRGSQIQIALMNAFKLIRNLHWGFFKDIDYPSYPKVWKELIIPDADYKYAGNLKRNMTISSIYIGMLDIHGYTKFCRQSNRNLSMLELLDSFMQGDISKITQENNVVSRRARGDEIILVGTSATDIINSVLSIIDYFSKRKIIKNDKLSKSRPGVKIILPDMHVTAGIAGGKIYTPLIITEDGDLSGDVVNTAARLQARANKISPTETRVIITKHVRHKYLKEQTAEDNTKESALRFFNSGVIEFKGTSLHLYDLIFRETDLYLLDFQDEMMKLYDSLKRRLWKNMVFPDLMILLLKVLKSMPGFGINVSLGNGEKVVLSNSELIDLLKKSHSCYSERKDYSRALNLLSRIISYLEKVPSFDGLILAYAAGINRIYTTILNAYDNEIENLVESKIDKILSLEEQKTYNLVKRHYHIYEKLRSHVRSSSELCNRKALWYKIIEEETDKIELSIYSGKV